MCCTVYEEIKHLKNSMGDFCRAAKASTTKYSKTAKETTEKLDAECPMSRMTLTEAKEIMLHDAHDQQPLVDMTGEYLQAQLEQNDCCLPKGETVSPFQGSLVPFTASYYVQRIMKYSGASPCCMVAALVYIERICRQRPELCLNARTLQRLVLVAAMEAVKYLEDVVCDNRHWASIGGLSLKELNALELLFLDAVSFNLSVRPEEYSRWAATVRAYHDSRQRLPRARGRAKDHPDGLRQLLSRPARVIGSEMERAGSSSSVAVSPTPSGPESPDCLLRRRGGDGFFRLCMYIQRSG